ncbi:molybdopterin-guanine dinucleotide biosynthesis protein B [Anoxybacteroides amylolyticum]|uniref:Molybdopterin-guanine dinucleotide biosynthesis protein B n=1 Tax=Anoxybacteroides amylolyticum TaxID=294699 RepID=A0A160F1H1_9BACL|nr:molybdopterin-guanine dinucleotide biosynthesis protein B [Anoxybacillus amylolyticus]ANB59987.1 molybdopterin-guanine dinucleotide biosynthesis protein B [Anoxybacillus amylolyticus]
MNVWQVVGYKNSGKTTLVEKWVRKAAEQGYKVGTIKHHGHGGYPDVCAANDSSRHQAAGAIATSVEGGGMLQLYVVHPWTLPQILHIYSLIPLDFVIVEGYKYERYPKIVIVRNGGDWQQLCHLEKIVAVITWESLDSLREAPYPVFSLNDEAQYLQWLMNEVKK